MVGGLIGSLMVRLGFDAAQFNQGAQNSGRIAQGLGRNLTSLVPSATVAAGALLAVGSAAVQSARDMQNFAKVANTSFGDFQKWAAGAKTVGVEADKLSDILKDVNDKVGDYLTTGGGGMADFFEKIAPKVGVTAEAFRGLSGDKALQLYVSSLEKAGVSQAEMVFYLEAIASDATLLVPLLRNGGAEFKRLGDNAAAAGAIMSDEMAVSLTRTGRAMSDLSNATKGLSNVMVGEAAPGMERMSRAMADIASSDFVRTVVGGLARNFDYLALGITAVGTALVGRFLSSLLVVNGAAISLSATLGALSTLTFARVGAGLLALAGGPIGAVLLAVGAVSYAFLSWNTAADDAKTALEDHSTVLDGVRAKYIELKGDVQDWADIITNTTKLQAADNLSAMTTGLEKAKKDMLSVARNGAIVTGMDDGPEGERLRSLLLLFESGAIGVDELKKQLDGLAASADRVQKGMLLTAMNSLDAMRPLERGVDEATALLTLIDDTSTAAERAAAEAVIANDDAVQSMITATKAAAMANDGVIDSLSNKYENHVDKLKSLGNDHRIAEKMLTDAIKAGNAEKIAAAKGYIDQIEEAILKTTELGNISSDSFGGIVGLLGQMGSEFSGFYANMTSGNGAMSASVYDEASKYKGWTEGGQAEELQSLFGAGGSSIDPRSVAWCAAFVNAVLGKMGIEGTDSLAARSFLKFGEETNEPRKGDIVVLSRGSNQAQGHVGFFEKFNEDGSVQILGGNQSNAVTSASFARDRVLGYRRAPTPNRLVDRDVQAEEDAIEYASIAQKRAEEAAEKAAREAEKAAAEAERERKKGESEKQRELDKAAAEAARIAQMRSEAVLRLVAEHEHYQQTLGMTATQERAWTIAKEAGLSQDKASIAAIEGLILQTDALKRKQEEMRAVVGTIESGFRDMWTGFLTGAKSAKEALADLLRNLGQMLANQAFNALWNGNGQNGNTGLGGAVNGFVGRMFGGGQQAGGQTGSGGGFFSNLFGGLFGGGGGGGGGFWSGLGSFFGIGANANGTNNWRGGLTMVGERGPELANLPKGTQIFDAQKTQRMMEGGGGAGGGRLVVELSPDLEARIVEQNRNNSMEITRAGLGEYDRQAGRRFNSVAQDPKRRG